MPNIFAANDLADISRGDQEGILVGRAKVATIATAAAVAFSPEQLLGGLILRDPAGAGRADTVPSAADMLKHLRGTANQGDFLPAFEFTIRNTADQNETITLTADNGATVTISGTATIAQNNSKRFLWVQTGAATATVYSLGTVVH